MTEIKFQGKRYVTRVLKGLTTQGIKINVETSKLINNSEVEEHDTIVVTPHGDNYVVLLGKTNPDKPEQSVRMLSKLLLKKALYELVNPPVQADPSRIEANRANYPNGGSYPPRRSYDTHNHRW